MSKNTLNEGSLNAQSAPDIVSEQIRIEEKIGGGCFGNVYKGVCRGKVVAIKKLHKQDLEGSDIEEFRKEVEIMTHLRHPNVVLFMGACTEAGNLMIVTEFLPRGDLHGIIHNPKITLSLLDKLQMTRDVAQGMNWLHCSNPPIIHRDLKPTNLLVDDNWNVKICDFGLSAIQQTPNIRDNGIAPGTPLWMSPEVLQGRSLDEKSDVYSFGIVLWELLTEKEPFEEHDSYNSFVRAVCGRQERPIIPEDMHPGLQQLLESCWSHESDERPSFDDIIFNVKSLMVDCIVEDEVGAEMWKENWMGESRVPWNEFYVVLYRTLGIPMPRELERNINFKCVREILAGDTDDIVHLEQFGLFLKWFGPLMPRRGDGILDKLRSCLQQNWFHGDIKKGNAETLLSDFTKKRGTFLVRLSTTDATKTPFTISKVNKRGNINHQRVFARSDGRGYYIFVKHKGGSRRIEEQGNIENLIRKVSSDLKLRNPCPGRKYKEIFLVNKVEGYLPSPEDEDSTESY
eukprot:TRINITY_DN4517_c0_g1_i1.p1 TRINITY_DN4517_c0_g1~~TRINITY_DN4517_c0_g1_i1.p1  ORF type:complete len:513 (+),score=130.33 TRINITY_DN4517_c0_g1_i1:19-1557(+)